MIDTAVDEWRLACARGTVIFIQFCYEQKKASSREAKKKSIVLFVCYTGAALCPLSPPAMAYVVADFPIVLRYGGVCASQRDTALGMSDNVPQWGLPSANGVE